MCAVLIVALTTSTSSKDNTVLEAKEKPGQIRGADQQNRVNSTHTNRDTNLFIFRKCGITTNQNRLRKSQEKGCMTMGPPNITPPPTHSTIKQVTLQNPKERANHTTNITIV